MSNLLLNKIIIDAVKCPPSHYPYNLWKTHSFVYSLFGRLDGDRILWADESERLRMNLGAGKYILVLSSSEPKLPDAYKAWCHIRSVEISEHFLSHHNYAFTLLANCTRTALSAKRSRTAITDRSELEKWLALKLAAGGCRLMSCELTDRRAIRILHDGKEHKIDSQRGVITLNACSFRGCFEVKDTEAFKELFSKGIGRAKAFGFGLLQLLPVKKEEQTNVADY